MSLINSVLSPLSPGRFQKSFEDLRSHDFELSNYISRPALPIPPPVTSSVLWSAPRTSLAPPSRVSDHLLTLQRRARYLEQQLQELLDAQADGLLGSLGAREIEADDLVSTGSTTPTVSSARSGDRSIETEEDERVPKKKKVGLNAARLGISRRIIQLADAKSEELNMLDEDLRTLQFTIEKTETWTQKRSRLERKMTDIRSENVVTKMQTLQLEASKLEQEIQQKEEELCALKRRHRCVVDELADSENTMEAKLSSYKTSLSLLDREVSNFLKQPPNLNHAMLSSSPFLKLPPRRRTLDMARELWQDEYTRLAEKCEEIDADRSALEEGVVVWSQVVKKVVEYEKSLHIYMQRYASNHAPSISKILNQMDSTITFLEDKVEFAASRSWNLLVCAIGAELEAFKQGKEVLETSLGISPKDKEKFESAVLFQAMDSEHKEQMTGSAIRISRSPSKSISTKQKQQQLFDADDDEPDPEFMISLQADPDTY